MFSRLTPAARPLPFAARPLPFAARPLPFAARPLPFAARPFLRRSPLWYWLSVALFLLAMLSKGSVVVMPALLLMIVWWLRSFNKMGSVALRAVFHNFLDVNYGVQNVVSNTLY